jgi:hypothetical protein
MTLQQLLNEVSLHLIIQGKKSLSDAKEGEKPSCVYRATDGCKCAAGWVIPDNKYSKDMEGKGVRNLLFFQMLALESDLPEQFMDLLMQLQGVHDCYQPDFWKRELGRVAVQFRLNLPTCLRS